MTMSTPALSPRPRDTGHSHSTPQPRPRPAPTPAVKTRPTPSRTPIAHAPLLSPRRINEMRTPGVTLQDVRTPSPNYFGLAIDTNSNADVFASSAAQHIRGNWSPPSSNVRSTAAASPRIIPVDQNPEFEQFRRQSENNKTFALSNLEFGTPSAALASSSNGSYFGVSKAPIPPTSTIPPQRPKESSKDEDVESESKPRSPKRLLSSDPSLFPERPRRNSPASFLERDGFGQRDDQVAEFVQDRHPRPSLPPRKSAHQLALSTHRAETLPANIDGDYKTDGPTMATPQHIVNILESAVEEVLLLDLRVSTHHAKARIAGALTLCIPTTLLKRPSFNVEKLAETFKEEDDKEKFERWRSCKYIIVYDANSTQLKDATPCINTLKKFTSEGWTGSSYIIKGGFAEFSSKFPSWVTRGPLGTVAASASLQIDSDLPSVAPVIGGCPMPATQNAANPFFGNIRQNMDLIGGVGQMPIKRPATMTQSVQEELPSWLQIATNERDQGKAVSDKFLRIEKREQKRMQEALSGKVVYESQNCELDPTRCVKIAGIEKGSKNRYNSIWPYEHSRVKIEGLAKEECDYINANHIQTGFSNKRYIATQGPLPATFNDFWNVVWQQDVRVIVMLTAETEGGQLKAHNYWSSRQYGHLYLNALGEKRASLEPSKIHKRREQSRPALGQRRSTDAPKPGNFAKDASNFSPSSEQPYVIVRKFTLANSNEPFQRMREITQLQYSSWPDFGAPAHPTHLLGLIEQCDAVVRSVNGGSPSRPDPPSSRPVLVHCSAGCGRTGTFVTVDSVLDMLRRQRQLRNVRQGTPMELDQSPIAKAKIESSPYFKEERVDSDWAARDDLDLIEKTVDELRLQRLSMVQSLRQFVLCYESILEWLVEQHPKSA